MFRHSNTKEIPDDPLAPAGCWLGVDVGGTHFSAALVGNGQVLEKSFHTVKIDASADAITIIDHLAELLSITRSAATEHINGIGIAMPGPFDYENGICKIEGLNKYESLFALNIGQALRDRFVDDTIAIRFGNDAACFGLGAARLPETAGFRKLMVITLGTGFGACFIDDKQLLTSGPNVPPNGYLYNLPFKGGIAEDFVSARGLLNSCPAKDVGELAERAGTDEAAANAFRQYGRDLKEILLPWVKKFGAEAIVIGGGIAGAYSLFSASLDVGVPVIVPGNTERVAIAGATVQPPQTERSCKPAHKTTQALLPKKSEAAFDDHYKIFPTESLGDKKVFSGYPSLARWIVELNGARLDGFAGIDWHLVRQQLCAALQGLGVNVLWHEVSAFLRSDSENEQMVDPFLGPDGSVWGKKTDLSLGDWYTGRLREWQPSLTGKDVINIIAGPGAGLCAWDAPIAYFDLPKNELQYRMRAHSASNLGRVDSTLFAQMYKRSYFVDWVVLNEHRRKISDDIVVVVDGQRDDDPNWAFFSDVLAGLESMAFSLIRARPWFEPGVWGGQWLKQHIPALSREEVNYAWSFELIAPENGIVLESDGLLLEIAFDWLMQWQSPAVLGVDAATFGEEFPIRFDFLDTFGGGNLSIQCHPSLPYIKEHFGERITQDETYYMLDTKPGSGVYLGFTETIQPAAFRTALEKSQDSNQGIDMEEFVQFLPAHKHDLFLIPNQTIHGSGVNNLVLEISATPYIFTFKMYDWMRLDLEGMPRPINIEHAFRNLDFSRKGKAVQNDLVSKPEITKRENGMTLENLPTHPEHFYGIERITLTGSTQIQTAGKFHLLMVVDGMRVTVETRDGRRHIQRYAETFIIPAFAKSYTLINEDPSPVILIKAFVKQNQNHI